jgi:hypothetical protein
MFVSCIVFVLSGTGLCDGLILRPEESYRLWCVSECDQVKINNLDTCCEQVGSRGKDCETRRQKAHNKQVTYVPNYPLMGLITADTEFLTL